MSVFEDSPESRQQELDAMDQLFDRLFPICRSITGEGLRETLTILSEYLPLDRFGIPSGTQVLDWTIPQEWVVRGGVLKGPEGQVIADFEESNLHIVNYSQPVNQTLSLAELEPNLYSNPNLPEAVPYVISYYKKRWGFCIPQTVRDALPEGRYHAFIDTDFIDGELNFSHSLLPGTSDKEIMISSYVCHPSMANNELSGPLVAAFLYRRLADKPSRRFTYRFVFAPETIGSISYLSMFGEELMERLHAGLVLTCMGGDRDLSYKQSRRENTPFDLMWAHLLKRDEICGETRAFTPVHGSDERQYCSPGFNLPVGQMSRTVYGTYEEYHNSLDTKEFMTIDALQASVDELEKIMEALEWDGYYVNRSPYGEIKLDRHGLYPDLNAPGITGKYSANGLIDQRTQLSRILIVLNYADGQYSMREIAEKCGCSILALIPIVELLLDKGIISGPFEEKQPMVPLHP